MAKNTEQRIYNSRVSSQNRVADMGREKGFGLFGIGTERITTWKCIYLSAFG
jgi:hypothetical protein